MELTSVHVQPKLSPEYKRPHYPDWFEAKIKTQPQDLHEAHKQMFGITRAAINDKFENSMSCFFCYWFIVACVYIAFIIAVSTLWSRFWHENEWDSFPLYPQQHLPIYLTQGAEQTGVTSFQTALYTDHTVYRITYEYMNGNTNTQVNHSMKLYQFINPPPVFTVSPNQIHYRETMDIAISYKNSFNKMLRLVNGSVLNVQTDCANQQVFSLCYQSSALSGRYGKNKADPTCTQYVRSYNNNLIIPDGGTIEHTNNFDMTWMSPSEDSVECRIQLSYAFQQYDLQQGLELTHYEASASLGRYLVLVNPMTDDIQVGFSYRVHMNWIWTSPGVWFGGGFVLMIMLHLIIHVCYVCSMLEERQDILRENWILYVSPDEQNPKCCSFCCGQPLLQHIDV